jgi:hypothetical protein
LGPIGVFRLVDRPPLADLSQVRQARYPTRRLPCPLQRGQQQGREQRDDRRRHQKLHNREARRVPSRPLRNKHGQSFFETNSKRK